VQYQGQFGRFLYGLGGVYTGSSRVKSAGVFTDSIMGGCEASIYVITWQIGRCLYRLYH
jgi:hypothetical protein